MAQEKEKTTEDPREPKVYELGFLLVPTIAEEGLLSEVSALKEKIGKHGGTCIAEEFPKKIALTYRMAKEEGGKKIWYDNAYFGWVKYGLASVDAEEISEALKKTPSVLRHLLIKTVRESTLAPKRPAYVRQETPKTEGKTGVRRMEKEKEKPAMTEAELDRTIEELVIE